MECQAGPICSVSSDASSAVRHKVELFYYYEKVSLIRLKLYFFIEVVIMTEIQRKSLITLRYLTFLKTSGPYF
jgi:hypothetical protein